jgi:multiple sugar transport system substrate-binding protein
MSTTTATSVIAPNRSGGRAYARRYWAFAFPPKWFATTQTSLKMARSGLPVIVPVTEFRDTLGTAITDVISRADLATELKKATAELQPVLDKSNEA